MEDTFKVRRKFAVFILILFIFVYAIAIRIIHISAMWLPSLLERERRRDSMIVLEFMVWLWTLYKFIFYTRAEGEPRFQNYSWSWHKTLFRFKSSISISSGLKDLSSNVCNCKFQKLSLRRDVSFTYKKEGKQGENQNNPKYWLDFLTYGQMQHTQLYNFNAIDCR